MSKKKSISTAAPYVPTDPSLDRLRSAAAGCRGCDLWERATQTVFGEGRQGPGVMLVGEQPGDQEDLSGHPFVGPAGRILNLALEQANIDRNMVYVTNAVKHVKWEPQGKRRKHKKPSAAEIAACRPWLEAEVKVLGPRVIVCLGVTAAQSVFGKLVRLNEMRGKSWSTAMGPNVFVTVHPSAILRHPEAAQRAEEYRRFVQDLRRIGKFLKDQAA